MTKSYHTPGFQPDVFKEEDHIFGATNKLPDTILNESGDWRAYLPKLEVQRNNNFDTYSCVSFANNNVCEIMHKKLYGEEVNYSDRFLSVMSGTIPGRGNSHNSVAEAKRKDGSVNETDCPFTPIMTQNDFFKKIPKELQDLGLKWTIEYEYGYEKVAIKDFKEALKRSPIQVAVDSRTNRTAQFRSPDHSVVLVAKNDKNYIYDSYIGRHVEYDLDYPFSFGLRVHYKRIIKLTLDNKEVIKEEPMVFYKRKDDPKVYQLGVGDGLFHWLINPEVFHPLYGDFSEVNIKEIEIPDDKIGFSLYNKKSFADLILKLLGKGK